LDEAARLVIERIATFRHECERVGRAYNPVMVGVTRGLQIVHNEEERKRAIVTRRQVLKNIGDLARGPGAERYAHIKEDEDSFVLDDAPLLGTPEEIIAQLKRLEAGGVENVLFAAPGASVAGLRTFAEEIMPAFDSEPTICFMAGTSKAFMQVVRTVPICPSLSRNAAPISSLGPSVMVT